MAILPVFVLLTTVRSVAGDREAGVFEYMLPEVPVQFSGCGLIQLVFMVVKMVDGVAKRSFDRFSQGKTRRLFALAQFL